MTGLAGAGRVSKTTSYDLFADMGAVCLALLQRTADDALSNLQGGASGGSRGDVVAGAGSADGGGAPRFRRRVPDVARVVVIEADAVGPAALDAPSASCDRLADPATELLVGLLRANADDEDAT
jgi:hypothetical protein